jgi:hypothetical protein
MVVKLEQRGKGPNEQGLQGNKRKSAIPKKGVLRKKPDRVSKTNNGQPKEENLGLVH